MIQGAVGEITIPSIGLSIATMSSWNLQRREDATPGSGEWDLRAFFSYVNQTAWQSNDWVKEIRVTIGNQKTGKVLRVTPAANGRMVLDGNALHIEGVDLDGI